MDHLKIDTNKLEKRFDRMQRAFVNAVNRDTAKYVPHDTGILESSSQIIDDNKIKWDRPYARYVWYGKLMVEPSGSAWARRGEKKRLTNTDLQYNTSINPKAGPFWFERAKKDNINNWIKEAASQF